MPPNAKEQMDNYGKLTNPARPAPGDTTKRVARIKVERLVKAHDEAVRQARAVRQRIKAAAKKDVALTKRKAEIRALEALEAAYTRKARTLLGQMSKYKTNHYATSAEKLKAVRNPLRKYED